MQGIKGGGESRASTYFFAEKKRRTNVSRMVTQLDSSGSSFIKIRKQAKNRTLGSSINPEASAA